MPEQHNIEFKQSWHDDYLKWVCGFANTVGGSIFIGKDDKGNVVHLENFVTLMDIIPQKIHDILGIICDVNKSQSIFSAGIVTWPLLLSFWHNKY